MSDIIVLFLFKYFFYRHKGQRDYKCGVCNFYGYTFTDIRKHIERRHTDSRTSACNRCGMMFKSVAALEVYFYSFCSIDAFR